MYWSAIFVFFYGIFFNYQFQSLIENTWDLLAESMSIFSQYIEYYISTFPLLILLTVFIGSRDLFTSNIS